MARKARVISENGLYHIYFKGNCNIFRSEEDFEKFNELIANLGDGFEVYAFGFSKQDGHLFAKTGRLSENMKKLLTDYAMWFNRKYRREGALFCSRYKSEPAHPSYAAGLARYITTGKKYFGYSDYISSHFESEQDLKNFMKQPEHDTYGADKGTNSAVIKLNIEAILNGKSFLQLSAPERADTVKKLSELNISQTAMAKYFGVSRGTVINCIKAQMRENERRRREEIVIL